MNSPRQWKTQSIFLTSTFQDMHAERDWLRDKVFPELEERLRRRFHHLEVIDLRWGVDVSVAEGDEARERAVLRVCLNEIERSRPFLIGLLGQRYGWRPPQTLLQNAAAEAGFDGYPAGASVTDLEISYGVLGDLDREHRCWFYFREPPDCSSMSADIAARYDDRFNPDAMATGAVERLRSLKKRIEAALPGRVRRYRCSWDAETLRPTGLEEFGSQILEDLWSDLEEQTRAFLNSSTTSLSEQSELNLADFVESRSRHFVGRDKTIGTLLDFCRHDDSDGWGVCVTGPAGSGKSSVFARLYRLLTASDILVLAHAAGIDATSARIDNMLRHWIGVLAGRLSVSLLAPEKMTAQQLVETFERLLTAACETGDVVLLVDALDQLEDANVLRWLPQTWPDRARLICTSLPGPPADAMLGRSGVRHALLPPVGRTEAAEIIRTICARYHRKPPAALVTALLTKKDETGQPAHGNPLWLVLATEELNLLGAGDFARAETEFARLRPEERLDRIVQSRAEELPAQIENLFEGMLDRAERLHGRSWTQAFVLATAISQTGWRELDFKFLIPEMSHEPWDPLHFAAVRRSFRGHVVQRGTEGRWDFMHRQLRDLALKRRNDLGIDLEEAHLIAGDYLFDLPDDDSLKRSGIMRHLILSSVPYAAGTYLAHHASNRASFQPALEAVAQHLGGFDDETKMQNWFRAFLSETPDAAIDNASMLCQMIAYEGPARTFGTLPLPRQRVVLEVLTSVMEAQTQARDEAGPDFNLRSALATYLGDLAGLEADLGDLRAAEVVARRALEIQAGLGDFRTDELIERHLTLGNQMQQQGDAQAATREFMAALPLTARLVEENSKLSEDFQARSALLQIRVHLSLADVTAEPEPDEAERHALSALRLGQAWIERRPTSASWPETVAVAEEKLGNVCSARQQFGRAEEHYGNSYRAVLGLSERNPLDRSLRKNAATGAMKWAASLHALGRSDEALARYGDAFKMGDAVLDHSAEDVGWTRQMALGRRDAAKAASEMGQSEKAIEHFERMYSLCDRLPGKTNIYDQIRSECMLGLANVFCDLGNYDRAIEIGQEYLAQLERLGPLDSLSPFLRGETAVAHDFLGRTFFRTGDLERSLSHFEATENVCESCIAAGGELGEGWWPNLANALRSSAGVLQQLGRMEDAIGKAARGVEIDLARVSDATPDRQLAAISENLSRLAPALAESGETERALGLLRRSIDLETRRKALEPDALAPAIGLAKTYETLGHLLFGAARLPDAMNAFRSGADTLSAFVSEAPDGHVLYQHSLCSEGAGACLEQLGRYEESLAIQSEVLATRQALIASDPSEATWSDGLMISHFNMAELCVHLDHPDQAAGHAEQCAQMIEAATRGGRTTNPALTIGLDQLRRRIEERRRQVP